MAKRCASHWLCSPILLAAVALFQPPSPQCHAVKGFPPLVEAFAFTQNAATISHEDGKPAKRQRSLSLPGCHVAHLRCWSSSPQLSSDETNNYSNDPEQHVERVEYRPISDYVGGLHGGKYEFDPRLSGITSLNYEKSVIFGDITAAGAAGSAAKVAPTANLDEDTPPSWTSRPVDYSNRVVNVLRLEQGRAQTVTILNEELSWEPFYASVESSLTGHRILCDDNVVRVVPSSGTLAPRGGANRYADRVRLQVHIISKPSFCNDADGPMPEELYLVVRTECDVWTWRLIS